MKKIVIRRFEREALQGFVNPQAYLRAEGLEVLSPSGAVLVVPYDDVKAAYFVRDFDAGEPSAEHRLFLTRPKTNGVWVRMKFRDGEVMDGLIAYYRQVAGEHRDWDEYRAAMERERRVLLRMTIERAGPDTAG